MIKISHNEHLFIERIENGYLKVDENGRIWRIKQNFRLRDGVLIVKDIMKEFKCQAGGGYIQVTLSVNGKQYFCLAHRVVWIYLNGEIPDNLQINHINGIKTDNRPKNLEIVTHK